MKKITFPNTFNSESNTLKASIALSRATTFLMLILIVLNSSSCDDNNEPKPKDACANTKCLNGGECINGICHYTDVSSGEKPETQPSDFIEGTWVAVNNEDHYITVEINKSRNQVTVKNLFNSSYQMRGLLNSELELQMEDSEVPSYFCSGKKRVGAIGKFFKEDSLLQFMQGEYTEYCNGNLIRSTRSGPVLYRKVSGDICSVAFMNDQCFRSASQIEGSYRLTAGDPRLTGHYIPHTIRVEYLGSNRIKISGLFRSENSVNVTLENNNLIFAASSLPLTYSSTDGIFKTHDKYLIGRFSSDGEIIEFKTTYKIGNDRYQSFTRTYTKR